MLFNGGTFYFVEVSRALQAAHTCQDIAITGLGSISRLPPIKELRRKTRSCPPIRDRALQKITKNTRRTNFEPISFSVFTSLFCRVCHLALDSERSWHSKPCVKCRFHHLVCDFLIVLANMHYISMILPLLLIPSLDLTIAYRLPLAYPR